ncbi:uncharacterized protein [Ptychodera flava]|uniref:uncharacterized protein n=1 Tax=Ptychodera flava TaxID=63121 RepID=UPI00396A0D51
MPLRPLGQVLQVSNVTITFEKYPDFYNVTSYTVKLCKVRRECLKQNRDVKTFHTTFQNVEPGVYEGRVAPSGCLECIWRATQPINVREWKPSFVNVEVTAEDTVSVYFDTTDEGSAGMEIQKYTVELINLVTNETRSLEVTKQHRAYMIESCTFSNLAIGTYKAKAKAARCTIGCPWAVSKSVQVPVKVEIPHPHTTDSSSSVSSTTVIGTQRHDPSTLQKVTTQPKDVTRLALGVAGGVIGGLLLVLVLYCVRRKRKSKSANYLSNSPSTSTFGIIEDTRGSLDDPTCNEDDTEALISLTTPQPQPPPPPEGGEEIPPYRYYKPPAHDQMSGTDGMSSIIQKLNMSPDNQEVIFDQYRRKEAEGEEVRPVLSADEELTQNWYGGPEYHPEMYNGSTIPGSFRPPYVYVREISLERKSDEAGGDRFDSGFQEMEQLERMRDFDQLEHMRTLVVEGMKAHTSTVSADIHNDSRSINI